MVGDQTTAAAGRVPLQVGVDGAGHAHFAPRALTELGRTDPGLRAGSVDLVLLGSAPPFRPPDAETSPLVLETLAERALLLAVPATHPLACGDFGDVADLRGQRWIAGPSSGEDRLMGVWPGLDEWPEIAHSARDWFAKLHLFAAGLGLTTVAAALAAT